MNKNTEMEFIQAYPKQWKAFYMGVKFCYPTEIPPMIEVRRKFIEFLKAKYEIGETGILNQSK